MKKFKSLLAVLIVALAMMALVACPDNGNDDNDGTDGHDFTVTIYDVDGTPCDWLEIQACEVGNGAMCYPAMKMADENGVAFLDIGDDPITQLPNTLQSVEIHLPNMPGYLTFDTLVLKRGESGTINLRYKTDAELDAVNGGTGVGAYLTGDDANKIDRSEGAFDPYTVSNGMYYRIKFSSADQKIYFGFDAKLIKGYKVFLVGGLNAKIVELVSDGEALVNDGEHEESGVDCVYEFSPTVAGQMVYFEVSLASADDVNKDAIICFETNR